MGEMMTTNATVWLALSGFIFIVWAAAMFWMLWLMARDGAKRRKAGEGPIGSRNAAFYAFFKNPEHSRFRFRLGFLTLLIIVTTAVGPFILTPAQ